LHFYFSLITLFSDSVVFSTTHGYILAHIALKINICFPLGKKFARLTHQAKVTRMRRAIIQIILKK
ncbi:hypothetical protein, partial [Blautia wexlerae]|uniref:hypothetical protein n=2 Tax=Blautia wexlerae TaxID=418240 RepID=UPI001A9B9DA0